MNRTQRLNLKSVFILSTVLTMAGSFSAFAQGEQEEILLQEIVVTAGRTPLEADKSGRAITVITGKQLEQNQIRYVGDALRYVPGISVSRTGTKGGMTNVRIRGSDTKHVLVMIDGIEVTSADVDAFDFGAMETEGVERIEVLRGPQSAFWGASASAGVINIITKGGNRDGYKISAMAETGSHNSWLGGVQLQGGAENYDLGLSASYRHTKGFNISDIGNENDGDENLALNGKVNIDLSDTAKLDATLRYMKNRSDLDGWDEESSIDNYAQTANLLGSVGLTWTGLDGALTQKIRFTGNGIQYKNVTLVSPIYETKGRRYTGSYQASYAFDTPEFAEAHHIITGGTEWKRETFNYVRDYQRDSYGFVGEYNGEFLNQYYLNFGLRHDVNDDFKNATTFSLSGAWEIPDTDLRLHSSIGAGSRNPSFVEQFGVFAGDKFIGNPDLRPEKNLGWDIGIEHRFFTEQLRVDVTYFNNRFKDKIVGDKLPNANGGDWNSLKNDEGITRTNGVEIGAVLNLSGGLSAGATYTYTNTKRPDNSWEQRVPRHSGSLNATYSFYEDRARIFGEAVFNGKMDDTNFNVYPFEDVVLKEFTVVNIGGSYKFTDKLEGYARIENLFDKKYQEVYGYNTPGRGAFAGIKASF